MSYRTAIYQHLASDSVLAGLLSTKPMEYGTGPAIYEQWAAPGTETPYLNLTYTFGPAEDLAKRTGTLTIDIFTSAYDSTIPEAIERRLVDLLDVAKLYDEEDGPINLYLGTVNEIPENEEESDVLHFAVTFTVTYYRKRQLDIISRR